MNNWIWNNLSTTVLSTFCNNQLPLRKWTRLNSCRKSWMTRVLNWTKLWKGLWKQKYSRKCWIRQSKGWARDTWTILMTPFCQLCKVQSETQLKKSITIPTNNSWNWLLSPRTNLDSSRKKIKGNSSILKTQEWVLERTTHNWRNFEDYRECQEGTFRLGNTLIQI